MLAGDGRGGAVMSAPLPENVRRAGYDALEKLAACMDAWWPGGSPYEALAWRLREIDGQREEATKHLGGNVISGPWDTAG